MRQISDLPIGFSPLDYRMGPSIEEYRHMAGVQLKARTFLKESGIVRRPCACGAHGAHMHHPDYDHWYLVAFLCARCHLAEHRGRLSLPYEILDLRDLVHAESA